MNNWNRNYISRLFDHNLLLVENRFGNFFSIIANVFHNPLQSPIHNDSPTNAGGVGLYVKNGLKYSIRNDLNLYLSYCEDILIEVKSTKQSLILSTIYRHSNSVVANFQDKLCDILLKLENNKTSYVINGDFNINLLNTKNNKVKNYTNMLTSVGCNSLINSPTRYSNNCTL